MNDPTTARDVGAANLRFARALVGELHAAGVAMAVVCPGSRSTPLALAIAEHPALPSSVHIDERSAAFFALGAAKATGRPVALLCTSGTAGANFLPAVAEAHQARVPLVIMTADRPPELRAWGAAQTMEQRGLFAAFTRWFEEAPCPCERESESAYATALGRRAVCEATGPAPGPVHLNLPFREPLAPADYVPLEATRPPAAHLVHDFGAALQGGEALGRELRAVPRGVLLFGPDSWDATLVAASTRLASALGWPVLADPASGLRAGAAQAGAVISGADLLLREPQVAEELRPDLIVRFGGQPTSAALVAWLTRHASAPVWLVDPAAGFRDPQHRASRMLRVTARGFCELAATDAGAPHEATRAWRARWQRADEVARGAIDVALDTDERFLTPHVARSLWSTLPEGAVLCAANSMAIRDIDAFAGPRGAGLRVLANRGVNGIDGQVSAALGAALATRRPTVLWCGDLAFLHDLSGLLAGRLQAADLTVVVSNDDGGGIFEYLAVARSVPRAIFERVFAVPHGADPCAIASALGWNAVRATSREAFASALSHALAGGRHVIEVPVDRAANTALHRSLSDALRAALRRELAG
ncbi:MAG: 2-succinyl-5-enolpyruvyl-6-hydroxy-3-cyclohexene-1-carboxylic-acid synthase [Steroidobacteraceae bacterium]